MLMCYYKSSALIIGDSRIWILEIDIRFWELWVQWVSVVEAVH